MKHDNQSFVHVRAQILVPDEWKSMVVWPDKNGLTLKRSNGMEKWTLEWVFEKLKNDPDMANRYHMAYNPENESIRLTYKKRECA